MAHDTYFRQFAAVSLVSLALLTSGCAEFEQLKSEVLGEEPAPKPAEKTEQASLSAPANAETKPVTLSSDATPQAPAAEAQAPVATTPAQPSVDQVAIEGRTPFLVIRFNQNHVYFDDAVANAVKSAEAAKPGIGYDVVSYLPDISKLTAEQQANINTRASDNLRSVVAQIQNSGVTPDRIRIANITLPVTSQEIKIFVR